MTIQELDFYFPFIVFAYGLIVTIPLNLPQLMELAEERLPRENLRQLQAHRGLAMFCLVVGAFWSLQNLLVDGLQLMP